MIVTNRKRFNIPPIDQRVFVTFEECEVEKCCFCNAFLEWYPNATAGFSIENNESYSKSHDPTATIPTSAGFQLRKHPLG